MNINVDVAYLYLLAETVFKQDETNLRESNNKESQNMKHFILYPYNLL